MPLRKELDLEKTVAPASGIFWDVYSEEPPYHTAEELWEGLKQGDEGARLLFVFFLRPRKNERTRCSVEKAIAAEGKRWVGVLIEEAWRPYLVMRHRAVPYQGKPKSVVAIEGSRAQRRILARSGLVRYSASSVKERAAVRLQTTWDKIHEQWVVLWMDNWYTKQFNTNPDKNDKSLNATALAVLLLRDIDYDPEEWESEAGTPKKGRTKKETQDPGLTMGTDIEDHLRPDGKQVEVELDNVRIDQEKTKGQMRRKDAKLLQKRIESLEAAPQTGPIHVVLWEDNSM